MSAENIQEVRFTKTEIAITRHLFKHYKEKTNPRQLAKQLRRNHAAINKSCNDLEKKGLIKKEEIGNAHYYHFNYDQKPAKQFIEYLLTLEQQTTSTKLRIILHELERFKEIIHLGLLFGSATTSTAYNDVDVLLIYEKSKKAAVNTIKNQIRQADLIDKPIRYVEMTPKDIQKNKDDHTFYNIMSQNIIFHNPTAYIEAITWLRQQNT
ncbi:MarR family transcriptional regulator [Candidatus Woesearchaeota archaeon]|nr:MarR family transcriptional regulator [Candidatus Woesearchaeota archaeon]